MNEIRAVASAVALWPALLVAQPAPVPERAGAEQAVELYAAPVAEQLVEPVYPLSASMRGREGWVQLNFMVDAQGRAYEIYVAEHVGDDDFVSAARRALEKTVFTPARSGDDVVEGSASHVYRFIMEDGSDAARRGFATRYRRFMRALEEQPRAEAARELASLEDADIHNNYEYAYLNLARYFFANRYGTPLQQMEHLGKALGESVEHPEYESFLPEDTVVPSRRALFQLQVRNNHLGEALETWGLMQARGDAEGLAVFRNVHEQILGLRANDDPYGVAGRIGADGSWHVLLFKRTFRLADISGSVEELKLRCERSYVFFEFDREMQYDVSDNAGECSLEVVGGAGTTFTLVQR